jgi:hypothetical protein
MRLIGGFFTPAKGWGICVSCAESPADVTAVNKRAGVPLSEVLEAIELRPPEDR